MKTVEHKIGVNGVLLTGNFEEASCKKPAVLVLGGGGYIGIAEHERIPVAEEYFKKGFQTFMLLYSVREKGVFPAPQREALEAIAYIRENAEQFCVDPDKIAVVGFSAGGHLAASTGVYWNHADVNVLPERKKCKPNALVLVYPCITTGEYAFEWLADVHGKGSAFPALLSLENYVTEDTPPSFLCHSAADPDVPAMNSLLFAQELAKRKIPFELHVYKEGAHGTGLALGTRFADWFEKSVEFLNLVFRDN